MIIRINDMLKARREGLKKDEGFSLIELLVVVIIIGILAAIAIPIYIGVQNNAKDAATQSDLTNAKVAITAYYASGATAKPTFDSTAGTGLATYGYATSSGSGTPAFKTGTTPSATSFCISATSGSATVFYISDSTSVGKTAC